MARAEIKLAGVLAAHNVPFKIMDHSSEVLGDIFIYSKIAQEFAMKRTKATAIVSNVIGKSLLTNLEKQNLVFLRMSLLTLVP